MDDLFERTADWMDRQLEHLLAKVPRPSIVSLDNGPAYRFAEKSPQQAIVQKLARVVSGLRAASLLLGIGFLQEQAALSRMISEFEEDVVFLVLASRKSPRPEILDRYLIAFFEEESAISHWQDGKRVKGRNLVVRKNISNFVAENFPGEANPFGASNAQLAVGAALSGYVHGASAHIMEMYDPIAGSFRTAPSPSHSHLADHWHDLWNYFYRGIVVFGFAAWAFADEPMIAACYSYQLQFEKDAGPRKDF